MMQLRMVTEAAEAATLAARCPQAFEWLKVPAHAWWVAERDSDGALAGWSALRLMPDKVGFSGPTFVEEWARGHGLQRRFIEAKERHARQLGLERIRSSTDVDNVWSANNLIRSGYLLEPCWDPRYPHDLYFVKTL